MKDQNIKDTGTIIVGGGQAGLSVGRYLKEYGRPFIILEKSDSVGRAWEGRYDSLKLDSFAKYSHLEGFAFGQDPMHQPNKDEVVEYLKSFAEHFGLEPELNIEVKRIEKVGGKFIVHASGGIYRGDSVVIATGPFHKSFIPRAAESVPQDIYQMHSKEYKNPSSLPPGATLVVGGGNSGAEIAKELAESGREVFFSHRGNFRSIKSSSMSQWLGYRLGLAHLPRKSWLGKIIIWYTKGKAVGVDVKALMNHPNITQVGAFESFADMANHQKIKNIIWATGYESDFSILSIGELDPIKEKRGVTNVPGLYLLNIRWQYSKSSSHLAGVSRDAKYIASHIAGKLKKS